MGSRVVLKKQIQRLTDKGWTLNTGLEPEFSLFKRNEDGSLGMVDESDNLDKPCYDYKGLSRSREFLEKFVESLQAVDYDVYQIDHEDANGQFEINYTYSDALPSADRFTFVRMAAGEIANDLGMVFPLCRSLLQTVPVTACTSICRFVMKAARTCLATTATAMAWACRKWLTTSPQVCCITPKRCVPLLRQRLTLTSVW